MKLVGKKILTGTIAATLLLGGAAFGILHSNNALADTTAAAAANSTSGSANASDHSGFGGHGHRQGGGFGFGENNLIKETATILNTDQQSIQNSLQQGKTLAQIAQDSGLAEADYLQKLVAAETQSIDANVTSGKITQAQADKIKSGLSDRLKKEIENTHQNQGKDGFRGGKGREGFGGDNLVKEAATIFNVDQSALTDELKQGKTLAQVAQEKGISEDSLIQQLATAEGKNIDAAVAAGKMQQADADKIKANLTTHLKQEVENAWQGDHRGGHGDFGPWGNPQAIAQVLGITQQELQADLQAGKSIAQVAQDKGISEEDLINKIKDGMTDQLKQFVEKTRTPDTKAPASNSSSNGSGSGSTSSN